MNNIFVRFKNYFVFFFCLVIIICAQVISSTVYQIMRARLLLHYYINIPSEFFFSYTDYNNTRTCVFIYVYV